MEKDILLTGYMLFQSPFCIFLESPVCKNIGHEFYLIKYGKYRKDLPENI